MPGPKSEEPFINVTIREEISSSPGLSAPLHPREVRIPVLQTQVGEKVKKKKPNTLSPAVSFLPTVHPG